MWITASGSTSLH